MSDKNLNPFILFQNWFESASEKEINDPNAMCLSTVDNNNCPHSRMVLLKGYDESGFRFFTNYESNKSIDIEQNKNVALNFHWKSLQRQIRIEGLIDKLNTDESDEYYNSRHYMSRIGAWASDQSRPLKNREELEKKMRCIKKSILMKTTFHDHLIGEVLSLNLKNLNFGKICHTVFIKEIFLN